MSSPEKSKDLEAHSWGPPVAGAGSSKICTKCGIRQVIAGNSPCAGRSEVGLVETTHDYDPIP